MVASARFARIEAGRERVFLKYDRGAPDGFFAAEAAGLARLRSAESGLIVPRVLAHEDGCGDWSWIALEWLDTAPRSARRWSIRPVTKEHREVDLAMSELFGGFDQRFYEAYFEAWPAEPGYEARKGVYQLYSLLVHVNLFGASYMPRTLDTLRRVLREA